MPKNEEPKLSQEQPLEQETITPEHSPETQEIIDEIGKRIGESEDFVAGLGRVAKEEIVTDAEAFDEIYAPKEIGRIDLKAEHDASAFESAGVGLKVRNVIRDWISFTSPPTGSRYALKGEDGLVDTRKLKEGKAGEERKLSPDELTEVAQKFGLGPEEMRKEFLRTYVEGKKGAEKVILREKSEQEMEEIAAGILERRLKDLAEKAGPDLVKEKQSLEDFAKETEQIKSELGAADIAKLEGERQERQDGINKDKQILDDKLDVIRLPLLERQRGLTEMLADFSELSAGATAQEAAYRAEIKGLESKTRKIGGTKQVAKSLAGRIEEWKKEKDQLEVNLRDFEEKKKALNKRIAAIKTTKAEVDSTLERINKIGKTPAELKAEKEEQRREARTSQAAQPLTGLSESDRASLKAGRKLPVEWQESAKAATTGQGQASVNEPADEEARRINEWADSEAEAQAAARRTEEAERAAEEGFEAGRPDRGMGESKRKLEAEARVAVAPRPEAAAPAAEPTAPERPEEAGGEREERRETETERPVRFWLNAIFKRRLPSRQEEVMMKHFKITDLDKLDGLTMTAEQAQKAYAGFLIEASRSRLIKPTRDGWAEAFRTVKDIVRNLDESDQEEQTAAAPVGQKKVEGEEVVPGLAEEFGEAMAKEWDKNISGGKTQAEAASRTGGGRPKTGKPVGATTKPEARTRKSEQKPPFNGLAGPLEEALEKAEKEAAEKSERKGKKRKGKELSDDSSAGRRRRLTELSEKVAIDELKEADRAAETPGGVAEAESEQAEAGEEIKWPLRRWKEILDFKGDSKAERVFKKNFQSSPETVGEAIKAYKRYQVATGGLFNNDIKRIIRKNIQQAIEKDNK